MPTLAQLITKKPELTGYFVCYEFLVYLIVERNSFGPKPIP